MKTTALSIDLIRTDGGTQMRSELSQDVYFDYRDKWLAGTEFDPVEVFHDGSAYWLADGFHRFYGAREAKRASIPCRIHQGTQRDAILFACGANAAHGLRRTNADKRRSVEALLNDPEWVTWSDGRIAEKAAVSREFVSQLRNQLATVASSPAAKAVDQPRVGKDGKSRKAPEQKSSKPNTAPDPREPGDDPRDPAHDDSVRDEFGPVAPRFRAVFSLVSEFRGLVQKIGRIQSEIEDLQRSDAGAFIPVKEIIKHCEEMQRAVKFSTPHCECPRCKRKPQDSCKVCNGLGWLNQPTFTRSKTKEDEQWLLSRS